jgi:hypothetical protein
MRLTRAQFIGPTPEMSGTPRHIVFAANLLQV